MYILVVDPPVKLLRGVDSYESKQTIYQLLIYNTFDYY